jgi:hypothetical protein
MVEKKKEEKKEEKKEVAPEEPDMYGPIWRGFGRFVSVLAFVVTCVSCYGVYSQLLQDPAQSFNPKLRYILYFYALYVYYTFYRNEPISEKWSISILIINAIVILFFKIDADTIISNMPPNMAELVNKIIFYK